MAPAQKHVQMCGDEIQSGLKISPVTYDADKLNESPQYENNNTVLRNSANEKVNSDADFDISKYEAIDFKAKFRWPDLTVQILLHLVSIYGLYLTFSNQVKLLTLLFGKFGFLRGTGEVTGVASPTKYYERESF
ncbi:hypothetical protein HF086_010202 [Spodoptera exigua]|uniref:Uncharacterized protein n=1 Tax=Spodoptera exigua TaxID=7107 RepID=A0A922M8B9_SPOEX|nr:hypothetical protein HF086_010202 [Spodoptera exigua]